MDNLCTEKCTKLFPLDLMRLPHQFPIVYKLESEAGSRSFAMKSEQAYGRGHQGFLFVSPINLTTKKVWERAPFKASESDRGCSIKYYRAIRPPRGFQFEETGESIPWFKEVIGEYEGIPKRHLIVRTCSVRSMEFKMYSSLLWIAQARPDWRTFAIWLYKLVN